MSNWIPRCAFALLLTVAPGTALAYDEAFSPDLSSNAAAPTPQELPVGTNTFIGTVASAGDIRDYFTFTIPAGKQLTAIRQVGWGEVAGGVNIGFHAIIAGSTSLVPDATNENSFLGGDHLVSMPTGTDLLPGLADGVTAGTGFSLPLGPGTYTYHVQ